MLKQTEVIAQDGNMLEKEGQSGGTSIDERALNQVRTLEAWYAAEFQRRLTELTDQLNSHMQVQIEELQQHYERRAAKLQEQIASAPVVPVASVAPGTPVAQNHEGLLDEIKRTESVAQKCTSEMERMVADDTVNLGVLLQMRNQELEVKAYLRGLKFCVESAPGSPRT